MKLATLQYICRNYNLLWGIPFRIYQSDQLIASYQKVDFHYDLSKKYLPELQDTPELLNVILSPRFTTYAMIKDRNSDYFLIIGPGRSVDITDSDIRNIIVDNKLHLSDFDGLKEYLYSIKMMPVELFYIHCMTINAQINDEVVHIDQFLNDVVPYDVEIDVYKEMLEYIDEREEETYDSKPYSVFEQKVLFYIKNGMQEQLIEHLSKGYQGRPTSVAFDAIRQYKDRCISMVTLVSRASMDGGLNTDIAYKLFDLYCLKIEQSREIETLNLIIGNMLIDFSKRVKEVHYGHTENPTINRAISFINRNLNRKLSAQYIADELNITSGYLSVKFKKNVGVSLPNYINQQKVLEAKKLLQFTDRSLVDISDFLSYSSQCYFQNVFKKNTGITPLEYRKNITVQSKSNTT